MLIKLAKYYLTVVLRELEQIKMICSLIIMWINGSQRSIRGWLKSLLLWCDTALACSGCYCKIPQTGGLTNCINLLLMVLEARSLRWGCQWDWLPSEGCEEESVPYCPLTSRGWPAGSLWCSLAGRTTTPVFAIIFPCHSSWVPVSVNKCLFAALSYCSPGKLIHIPYREIVW